MGWMQSWILALSASTAYAFKDASPYMAFSTAELDWRAPGIASHKSVQDTVTRSLSECPTDFYILARQPGVNFADYTRQSAPHLKEWLDRASKGVTSSLSVSEMVGNVDQTSLIKLLYSKCGADNLHVDASDAYIKIPESNKAKILTVNLPELSGGSKRINDLRANDLLLSNLISALPSQSFTLLYSTSPGFSSKSADSPLYEMEDQGFLHMDMKRDSEAQIRDSNNVTLVDGPLFERYQYFTPGLFMGLIAMFFILTIAFVAVRALASLKVSYAAFDKENGPAAQKKAQ